MEPSFHVSRKKILSLDQTLNLDLNEFLLQNSECEFPDLSNSKMNSLIWSLISSLLYNLKPVVTVGVLASRLAS